ncbi:MAG: hypothetical protein HQM00_13740, partial [Magnetococcales bacterium]|nr:hypothetical protein [Magnetococcales bacterium]
GDDDNPAGAGNCRLAYGVLPWQELGLQPFDPWGNHFTYHLDTNFHDPITCFTPTTGNLTVRQDSSTGTVLAANLVAVVTSHGKNREGRILPTPAGPTNYITRQAVNAAIATPGETENTNNDALYVTNSGDDQLFYLSPL